MKIASVVGARPNFIKLIPIHKAIRNSFDHRIIHTGQHYDYELSEIFFKEFNLPRPNFDLNVGSGTACYQISEMIKKLEKIFLATDFDLVIVYGDTNSTFAGALAANRCGIKVAHVEAGLRSFDRRMPEENNRVLTDHISEYLFAPTKTAVKNLNREHVTGQIMYTGDISVEIVNEAIRLSSRSEILNNLQIEPKSYVLVTMHRAENTLSENSLISVINAFEILSEMQIVFPIHPRTEKILKEKKLYERLKRCQNVKLIKPVGYIDFIKLMKNARRIVTDSGGIQKEGYLLSIPCITIRDNTEWVETVEMGWNILTGVHTKKIVKAVRHWEPSRTLKPIFGNGQTSKTIKELIVSLTKNNKR
ncbi:MAG TPA: UDP-N-acetylglucosamine 2-epimerase (non-hydrolyzing) [Nitrosopumilaceae archaeon]|nr:UDP-N-acetylglucosamine 2-epimerase (non-hydrolyzing) [Nitrosopumilaceae archaeon]